MRWKRVLVAAILVVAALISAAWLIIAHYDYNKLKPQIERAFKEATGRDLILGGNLDLKIGFTPSLVVSNAALRNASWGSRPEWPRSSASRYIWPLFRSFFAMLR